MALVLMVEVVTTERVGLPVAVEELVELVQILMAQMELVEKVERE
jgi:hypothetical protein